MENKNGIIGGTIIGILVFGLVFLGIACTERIPAGYVGVVYSASGGVSGEVLGQGWHLVAPTKKVKEFTIGNEQIILSKDAREGSDEDESFAVATSDNANIDISFQMSYRFDESKVVETYRNFKGMDGEDIVNRRVKTVLKAKVSEVTTEYSMMDLYSGNRNAINAKLTKSLNEELHSQYGINVIDASIIDVHPDAQLQKTISDRVTALQKQQQVKAEQETVKLENETKLIQAEAAAKEQRIKAENDAEIAKINAEKDKEVERIKAEANKLRGEGIAAGNKAIAKSLTPQLIERQKYEKWDGKLPQYVGADTMIGMIN